MGIKYAKEFKQKQSDWENAKVLRQPARSWVLERRRFMHGSVLSGWNVEKRQKGCVPERVLSKGSNDWNEKIASCATPTISSKKQWVLWRTRSCYDNARMESFFATLKKELIYRLPLYKLTRAQVRAYIFDWIETYYNRKRRHTANVGNLPPLVKRDMWNKQQMAA